MASDDRPVRKRRWKFRGYYVLILALLVGIGWFGLYRRRLKSQLQVRMDAIRAAGYPVTCAEMDEWYSIPAGVANAADVILDAASWYVEPNEPELVPVAGEAELPGRTEGLSEEMKKAMAEYLASNKRTLELLHEAAGMEHSRYPVNLSAGFSASVPYLSSVRYVVYLLKVEAVVRVEDSQADQAVESIAGIFGVARSLSEEPLFISQLVRIACEAIGISAIERVVNRTELGDDRLAALSSLTGKAEQESDLRSAFVGERCMVLDIFINPEKMGPGLFGGTRLTGVLLAGYKAVGLATSGAITYLDYTKAFAETNQLAEYRRVETAKALERKLEQASGIQAMMVRMLMPAYARIIEISLQKSGALRTARVGLAIERYRLAAGKLPDTLGELVPAYLDSVPRDPFDGAELRYKRLEKGYVVYSIGRDGSDDGGKERSKGKKNYDVTFIVER